MASLPASLAIAELADFVPDRDRTVEAFVGNDVVIACSVPDSNPPAFVQFYKARNEKMCCTLRIVTSTFSEPHTKIFLMTVCMRCKLNACVCTGRSSWI